MKTDRLIERLAAEGAAQPPWAAIEARLALAAAAGYAAAAAITLRLRGLRSDLPETLFESAGVVKFGGGLALAAGAFALLRRLCRPGAPAMSGGCLCLFALAVAVAAVAIAAARVTAPLKEIAASAPGYALTMALVSAAPLTAVMLALSGAAPTRPGVAGAAGGLLAGAVACLGWALWCPADDALFVTTSYAGAIATTAAGGALLGPRLLRW